MAMSRFLLGGAVLIGQGLAMYDCKESGPWKKGNDHSGDRAEILEFGKAMNVDSNPHMSKWHGLLSNTRSMCDFDRVCCETIDGKNRVTMLQVERIGLTGHFPDSFSNLDQLQVFNGHLNYITNFPPNPSGLKKLKELKLGRNPITGTVPAELGKLKKLEKFNCNFCAVTGQFPDIFEGMDHLKQTFWDGNGLTGTIPKSLEKCKKLKSISFNLNSLTGPVPEGLCSLKLDDCRIGSDTEFKPYDTSDGSPEKKWLPKWKGNKFSCPVPDCIMNGVCNDKKANPVASPVKCDGLIVA